MAATIKFADDLRAGKLTPAEALKTLDLQLKAFALVFPPAMTLESYVKAEETLVEVADALQIVKIDHGLPYKGDGINPNTDAPIGV